VRPGERIPKVSDEQDRTNEIPMAHVGKREERFATVQSTRTSLAGVNNITRFYKMKLEITSVDRQPYSLINSLSSAEPYWLRFRQGMHDLMYGCW